MIQFKEELSPAAARALLKVEFSDGDHARMEKLSTKAGTGTLTPSEQDELDTFERLGCVLDILQSKARQLLKKKPRQSSLGGVS